MTKRVFAFALAVGFMLPATFVLAYEDHEHGEREHKAETRTDVRGFLGNILAPRGEDKHEVRQPVDMPPEGDRGTLGVEARIDARINHLLALEARIDSASRLSDEQKERLSVSIEAQIAALEGIKQRIASGEVRASVQADVSAAAKQVRAKMHALPTAAISAAADRILRLADRMEDFADRLEARITDAQDQGEDVSAALAAHARLVANVDSAKASAQTALSLIADISVDTTEENAIQENRRLLSAARDEIRKAHDSLRAARQQIGDIMSALKVRVEASADAEVE